MGPDPRHRPLFDLVRQRFGYTGRGSREGLANGHQLLHREPGRRRFARRRARNAVRRLRVGESLFSIIFLRGSIRGMNDKSGGRRKTIRYIRARSILGLWRADVSRFKTLTFAWWTRGLLFRPG